MNMNKSSIVLVDGKLRTPLNFGLFRAEPHPNPPPTEPTVIAGVAMTALQYSTLAAPRFLAVASIAAQHKLPMELGGDGIVWITEPFALKGIDLRWTPDEPGWLIIKGSSREFYAEDLRTALQRIFQIADQEESPEEQLMRSIFQQAK